MKKENIISNSFVWIPMDKRVDSLGLPLPPRKPELRKPLLWLARKDNELYFVNNSGETLDKVTTDTGGFQTLDDDVVTLASNGGYTYTNVKSGDAVKVDEYDVYFDCDFVIQIRLNVMSKKLGSVEIVPPSDKGGVKEVVLLWDTGESGRYCSINDTNDS